MPQCVRMCFLYVSKLNVEFNIDEETHTLRYNRYMGYWKFLWKMIEGHEFFVQKTQINELTFYSLVGGILTVAGDIDFHVKKYKAINKP